MAGSGVLFAGQGAQAVGMGRDLAESDPELMALYRDADRVLGYELSRICFEGPEEELTRSNHCQPAIFVTSLVCWTALSKALPGLTIDTAAGLSLGEWTALHVAGALDFEDALKALEARGRYMQEACEQADGAMVSVIGLAAAALQEISETCGVQMANINSSEQIVLSGLRSDILKAEAAAAAAGAKKTVVLNVAGAYHSRLMEPAAERLAADLAGIPFAKTAFPVLSNVTGSPHEEPAAIREAMVRQVTQSVNWLGCMQSMLQAGTQRFVECGPGRVLSGLLKRVDRSVLLTNIQDLASLEKTLDVLKTE